MNEPALFKFFTGDIAPDERIAEMTLELDPYFSMQAKACNDSNHAACIPCPASNIGIWHLSYARTDWTQSQATWNEASTGMTWAAAGASEFPTDRSAELIGSPASRAAVST